MRAPKRTPAPAEFLAVLADLKARTAAIAKELKQASAGLPNWKPGPRPVDSFTDRDCLADLRQQLGIAYTDLISAVEYMQPHKDVRAALLRRTARAAAVQS